MEKTTTNLKVLVVDVSHLLIRSIFDKCFRFSHQTEEPSKNNLTRLEDFRVTVGMSEATGVFFRVQPYHQISLHCSHVIRVKTGVLACLNTSASCDDMLKYVNKEG